MSFGVLFCFVSLQTSFYEQESESVYVRGKERMGREKEERDPSLPPSPFIPPSHPHVSFLFLRKDLRVVFFRNFLIFTNLIV
jgi:hypothetical protein